jgi:hypothetical protein
MNACTFVTEISLSPGMEGITMFYLSSQVCAKLLIARYITCLLWDVIMP